MKTKKPIIMALMAVLSVILITGCSNNSADTGSKTGITGNAVSEGDSLIILQSEITRQAKFYSYDSNGITINFFAVRGSDSKIRTAFDACDVCGGYKGYRQKGNDIICNNCGRVFSIDGLGTKNRGYGCWPSYLPHQNLGDKISIKKSDIDAGRSRFA